MKGCEWDPYENLPPEYNKIFRFQNFQAEIKQQKDIVESEGLPINGTYITLILEVDNENTYNEVKVGQVLVLSTLFPHECKITTMHFKLKRTLENQEIVPSKSTMEFSCGFRRLVIRPTFSAELTCTSKTDKVRYMRFLRKDVNVIASAYCPFVMQPCKIITFTKRENQSVDLNVVASGIALPPDPLKIILKRIVLTGYPLRVHKKRATIRYMFFDPKDVKYFKPVEIYTQQGLRGHIKDSLGTHGLLKAHFNDFIKQSDVACMPLYRRIFPQWYEKTWNPSAAEPLKKRDVKFE